MKSQLKEEYVIENIVVCQTIIEEDVIVKLNLKINVKIKQKARVIQNTYCGAFVNGWQIFQKLERCINIFFTLIFGREILVKQVLKKQWPNLAFYLYCILFNS